jgi:hypothetical protein
MQLTLMPKALTATTSWAGTVTQATMCMAFWPRPSLNRLLLRSLALVLLHFSCIAVGDLLQQARGDLPMSGLSFNHPLLYVNVK